MNLRKLRCLPLCLLLMPNVMAQTRIDLANQGRGVDFSTAIATKPSKTGNTFPATCSMGETFFKLNAPAGKNLYACTAVNTWTALSPALDVPNVSGNTGKLMSTDGSTPTWTSPAGDVSGAISSLTVGKIQGRAVSSAAPQNGNVLSWNSVLSQWQPASTATTTYVSGSGVSIAGASVAVDSATVPQYSIGAGVPSLSCDAGRDFYTDTTNGNLYFCKTTNTWQLLSRPGHTHGASDISSGTLGLSQGGTNQATWVAGRCVQVKSDGTTLESAAAACGPKSSTGSGAPLMACTMAQDLYTDTATGNLYYCSATNTWTLLSRNGHAHSAADVTSGTLALARGGTNQTTWIAGRCVQVKSDGTTLESATAACGPRTTTGTVAPSGTCTAGQDIYTDTTAGNLYYCSATNTWTLLSRNGHAHAAADVTSGTLALARGGTNQTTWTAGRCVQVKADGTTLESAAAACGSGGGGTAPTTVTDLITIATTSPYTFPSNVKYFSVLFCGGGGGGAGSTTTASGGGGGGGGCEETVVQLNGSTSMTFSIGVGGSAGAAGGNGGSGGSTSFTAGGFTYAVTGGSGGTSTGTGGAGGRGFITTNISGNTVGGTSTNVSRKDQGGPGGAGRNSSATAKEGSPGACVGGSGGAFNSTTAALVTTALYPFNGTSAPAGSGASGAPTAGSAGTSCNGGSGGGTDTVSTTAGGSGGSGYIRVSYTY